MKGLLSKFKKDKELSEEDRELKKLLGENYKHYRVYEDSVIFKPAFSISLMFRRFFQHLYDPGSYRR